MIFVLSIGCGEFRAGECETNRRRLVLIQHFKVHQQNDKKLSAFLGFSACRQAHKLLTSVPFSQMSRF